MRKTLKYFLEFCAVLSFNVYVKAYKQKKGSLGIPKLKRNALLFFISCFHSETIIL